MVCLTFLICFLILTFLLVAFPTVLVPSTEKGKIKYSILVRENVRRLEAYVEEMVSGDNVSGTVNNEKSTRRCGLL